MIETIRVAGRDDAATGARCAGRAGPALVFVHGVGSTAAIWDPQLIAFAQGYRCFAIELRGNGALRPDPDPASINRGAFADDVLTVTETLGICEFTLIGCSLGGVVAFELWKRARQRLHAIVFADSFAYYPNGEANVEAIRAAVLAAGNMRAFGQQRAAKLGLPPQRLQETVEQMACKSVACYLASTEATWTGDYRDLLAGISVPVQVVCGQHDTIAPPELSREIAGGIPNATFSIVKDAGHVSNADNPEVFNALVESFLQR